MQLFLALTFELLKVKILSLDNFPEIGEIDESGSTLLENSLIKAREVNSITGIPAIADDTGLEIDELKTVQGENELGEKVEIVIGRSAEMRVVDPKTKIQLTFFDDFHFVDLFD